MNILYITTAGFDTFSGNNHLNISLILELLKLNNVTLIQSYNYGPYKSIPSELENKSGLSIITVNKLRVDKNNKIARLISEHLFFKQVAKHINKKKQFDVIYVQFSGDSHYLIKTIKKMNIPIIYNMQDLFPETLITTKMINKGFIYNFFKKRQIRSFKMIDVFTVLSEDIKNVLISEYFVDFCKIEIVYNWFSEEHIHEVKNSENKFIEKYNLNKKNKYIIQYAGNLGYVLDYSFILEYAKLLKDNSDFEIQIVGNGSNEKYLKNEVNKNSLYNVKFIDIQPNSMVSDVYSYSDLQIIPLKKGVIFHSVPSKLSIVMKCKRPILLITDENSQYTKMLTSNNVVISCDNNHVEEAVYKTIELFKNNHDYCRLVEDAYTYTSLNFSKSNQIDKIFNILKRYNNKKIL